MTTKLLIVESPAKCQKIQGFLGAGWRVQATMGHIRALKEELEALGFPKGGRGDPRWAPTYETILAKTSAIANLRKAAAGAEVYLGSDDDREGEAIAWHTCAILGLDPTTTPRVVFHEITAPALRAAVAAPRTIDFNKFNAQQARSMLDMLIGFTLSPCLWRGVGNKPGLSAGRCQTPALRIIYDRDRTIETFEPTVTWRITANSDHGLTWKATNDVDGDAAAATILKALVGPAKTQTLTVTDRTERVATSQPPKPFITSSLQQEASSRLGMNPKVTMKAAQTLYEGGHITYMRTDNAILSVEASEAAAAVVRGRWGEEYLGGVSGPEGEEADAKPKKKVIKKKAGAKGEAEKPEAQAAHEGIRPTHLEVPSLDEVGANERRLYDLIWKRTIQSVMAAEERDVVKLTAVPTAAPTLLTLATDWDKTRFAGWRILDAEKKESDEAAAETTFAARAALTKDTQILWSTFAATETRSSAPSRYTEAALIRELEHRSIGRPSTYATLVETVLERGYVEKATIVATPVTVRGLELKAGAKAPKETNKTEKTGGEKDKLRTTALGRTVIEWLLAEFGDMIEYDFTAQMESQLDDVAKGAHAWSDVLESTWTRYKDRYRAIMDTARASTTAADGSIRGPKKTTGNTANRVEFGDGYKMIVSRKGPLFVLEREGETTRFASVPAHLSLQTATREDVEAAFTASGGGGSNTVGGGGSSSEDALGELDGKPVTVRNGKFGYYATWGDVRINCKQTDTMAELEPRLRTKAAPDAVSHDVGTFCIRRGPYGLYMFKKAVGSTKKPTFVSIPESTDYKALTLEGAEQLYKHSLDSKSRAAPKPKAKKAEGEEK